MKVEKFPLTHILIAAAVILEFTQLHYSDFSKPIISAGFYYMIWFKIFYSRASKGTPNTVFDYIVRYLGDLFWCGGSKIIETFLLGQDQNWGYHLDTVRISSIVWVATQIIPQKVFDFVYGKQPELKLASFLQRRVFDVLAI